MIGRIATYFENRMLARGVRQLVGEMIANPIMYSSVNGTLDQAAAKIIQETAPAFKEYLKLNAEKAPKAKRLLDLFHKSEGASHIVIAKDASGPSKEVLALVKITQKRLKSKRKLGVFLRLRQSMLGVKDAMAPNQPWAPNNLMGQTAMEVMQKAHKTTKMEFAELSSANLLYALMNPLTYAKSKQHMAESLKAMAQEVSKHPHGKSLKKLLVHIEKNPARLIDKLAENSGINRFTQRLANEFFTCIHNVTTRVQGGFNRIFNKLYKTKPAKDFKQFLSLI